MLLTETKIQSEANSQNQLGYHMTCSASRPSRAGGSQGGVGMLKRERTNGYGIPAHRRVSAPIDTRPSPGLQGSTIYISGHSPHCHWVFERGPRWSPDIAEPACVGPTYGFWYYWPGPALPTSTPVLVPEDLETSQTGRCIMIGIGLHPRDGPEPLWTRW